LSLAVRVETFSHQGFFDIASKLNDVEGVRENKTCYLQIITV